MSEPLSIVELDMNLDDIEAPELLPEGYYRAEVQNVGTKISSNGNDIYDIQFLIPPTEYPTGYDAENNPEGTKLFYNRLLVAKPGADRRTLYNVAQFQKKLGLSTNTNVIDAGQWIGQMVMLKLKHGSWQNEPRLEIAAIEANDEVEASPKRRKR